MVRQIRWWHLHPTVCVLSLPLCSCLCLDDNRESCPPVGSELYELTHNGVDMVMQQFLESVAAVMSGGGIWPDVTSREFRFCWNAL